MKLKKVIKAIGRYIGRDYEMWSDFVEDTDSHSIVRFYVWALHPLSIQINCAVYGHAVFRWMNTDPENGPIGPQKGCINCGISL